MKRSILFWLRAVSLVTIGVLTLSCSCSALAPWFGGGDEIAPATIGGPEAGTPMLWFDGATLRFIPAGDFDMGGDSEDAPLHDAYTDAYWIYETKVTKRMYARCVEAGACSPAEDPQAGDATFAEFPIVGVNHKQASAYCGWVGASLPSEAQWEKAARGPSSFTYPWGEEIPQCPLGNFADCKGNITPVTAYPLGASYYGLLDMAGNAYEWVSDWYAPDYYGSAPETEPTGPAAGTERAVRGSAYYTPRESLASFLRMYAPPDYYGGDLGFRCAIPVTALGRGAYAPVCSVGSYVPDYDEPGTGDPTRGGQSGPAPLKPYRPDLTIITPTPVPGNDCPPPTGLSAVGWCQGVVGFGDYGGINITVPAGSEGDGWKVSLSDGRALNCGPVPGKSGLIACTGPLRQDTTYTIIICGPDGTCTPGTNDVTPGNDQVFTPLIPYIFDPYPVLYPLTYPLFEIDPGIFIGAIPFDEPLCPPGYVRNPNTGACEYKPQTPEGEDCLPSFTAVVAPGYNCAPNPNPNGDCPVGHYFDRQAKACIPVGDPNNPCVYGITATTAFPQNGCNTNCPQGYNYNTDLRCCQPPAGGNPGQDCPLAYTFAAVNLTCLPGDDQYPQCPDDYYYDYEKKTCIPRGQYPACPEGAYYDTQRQSCICKDGYYDPKADRCIPPEQYPECPDGSKYDPRRQTCVCGDNFLFDPNKWACLPIDNQDPFCPQDSYYSEERGTCICRQGYYDPKNNVCVPPDQPTCPPDSYYDSAAQTCVCRDGKYNPLTGQCEGGSATPTPVPACPPDAYYDTAAQTCICRQGKYNPNTYQCEGGTTGGNCTTLTVYIPSCATPTPVPFNCTGLDRTQCDVNKAFCTWIPTNQMPYGYCANR